MVRNNKRRAFTIVELVIVIAVIAILAAVMIPTFGGIIKKANISADTQIAASMNTQLSIYTAEGNKIETEADLWKALSSDADFTSQLDPKSAKHGYHYWYNAEKNEIKLLANADVIGNAGDVETQAFAAGGDETPFAYAAPRLINGFYLLDKAGEGSTNDIANFFKVLDGAAELGDAYIEALDALKAITGDNQNLAATIAAKMLKTVVVSNNGVYYHAETTADANYYFIPGVTTIKATHHVFGGESNGKLPTPANNQLVLPSTVKSVEKDALNFATANSVTVVTSYASHDVLAAALASGCSNAIFTTTDGNAYIVEEYYNETKKENVDALFQYNPNGENSWKCDLKKRLPFSDFTIQSDGEGGNIYRHVGENDTIYVLITSPRAAVLHAQDVANQGNKSSEIDLWESDNKWIWVNSDGSIDFNVSRLEETEDYTAEITVTAINDQLKEVKETINVEIVRAKSASVLIDGVNFYLDGKKDHQLTLTYDGTTTYGVTLNGVAYSTEGDIGVGTNSMTIVPGENSMISVSDNKLSLDTSKSNNTFTISFDECIETTFYVNIINAENAEFTHTFYKSQTTERPFNIGTGNKIPLSAFLKYKGDLANFDSAKITIYDKKDGSNLYSVNEINNTDDDGLTAKYTHLIKSKAEWEEAKVEFIIDKDYADYRPGRVYTVYVEITDSSNNAVVFTINLVEDAVNVLGTNFATLDNDNETKFDYDVVLHGNVNVESGIQVDLGDNTLYGNGYIIDAKKYTGSGAKDYFISVNGGTIDNVYIDGPVYPTFEYITSTLGYHVSGIVSTSTSTVQHSYISGFRQPIALNGGILNVSDTTLYGGNYANLQVNGGTLNLTDVTTVQPATGMTDTFNQTQKVIGLGIVVEYEAVADGNKSAINVVDGYLDQYNWISYNDIKNLTLPEFKVGDVNVDFKNVLAGVFNGLDLTVYFISPDIAKVNKPVTLDFLNQFYHIVDGTKYLNTGIIFITLGSNAPNASDNIDNLTITDNTRVAGDKKFEAQKNPQLFSEYPVFTADVGGKAININASQAMGLLDKMSVDTSGKLVGSFSTSETLYSIARYQADVYFKAWSYSPTTTGDNAVPVGAKYEDLIGSDPENNIKGYYNYYVNYGK